MSPLLKVHQRQSFEFTYTKQKKLYLPKKLLIEKRHKQFVQIVPMGNLLGNARDAVMEVNNAYSMNYAVINLFDKNVYFFEILKLKMLNALTSADLSLPRHQ